MSDTQTNIENELRAEIEFLKQRLAALEEERLEQARRANAAVAAAQERAYWLDRWHVDLNAIMARPGADRVRAAARAVRSPIRWLRLRARDLRG